MKKRFLLTGICVLFAIALFTNCKNDISKPNIVKITPEKYLNLKNKINKKTIIHFWFSYCSPCIKDFPELLKISKENNIDIINVSSDKSDSKMQDNLEKVMSKLNVKDCYIIDYDNLYPNGTKYIDILGDFAKKIELKEYTNPYYILIDASGKTIIATEEIEKLKKQIK
ncbi:TlpA family protein disulfide reductase [Flavobacterium sp. TSSA_36]|uniref:TlpA family protein disulfide reductase n=1 Tax=Flavobacterium sp. TSSA_36 TaxID=3447669 RepID=UPI003F394978